MVVLPEKFGWSAFYKGTVDQLPHYLYDRLFWYLDCEAKAKADWIKRQEAKLKARRK